MHLGRSAAPVGAMFETMTIPDFVEGVLLINGQVLDGSTKHLYTAPCLLPHSCTKISKVCYWNFYVFNNGNVFFFK